MLQVPIEVDFNNLNPEQFKDMQNIDWQALADLSVNPATQEVATKFAWLAGGMLIVAGVVGIVVLILIILNLFNIWLWGTTDKAVYEAGGQTKKKWFLILFLVPIIATLIGIIPLIGWVVGFVLYIYYLVMILVYFFSIRKKVGSNSAISSSASSQGNKKV